MPIRLTCACGRTLSIPDQLAGGPVKCPACGAAVAVPPQVGPQAALPTIMPPRNSPVPRAAGPGEAAPRDAPSRDGEAAAREPGPEGRAARRGSRRRAGGSRGRDARREPEKPAAPAAPAPRAAPVPHGDGSRCPACNAPLRPNAILCTQCGAGLRAGGVMLGGRERHTLLDVLRSVGGPAVALAIVVGLVVAWRYGVFTKTKAPADGRPAAETPAPEATRGAAPAGEGPGPAAEGPGPAAPARFSGGAVSGALDLADAEAPYEIAETVIVPAGASLRLRPGVALKGAPGAELRVTGGVLVIEGSVERPVAVSMRVAVSGATGGFSARYAVFAGEVAVEDPISCRAEWATFMRGLRLAAKGEAAASEWKFLRCDLRPRDGKDGACLEVELAAPADRLKASVTESNLRGGVKGSVGWSSRLDLSGNHWQPPPGEALAGLKAEGSLLMEPVQPGPVAEAGAPEGAASALGSASGRALVNEVLGYRIVPPEGWRAAGESMLLAPERYRHPTRIQVERRTGERKPSEVPRVLLLDVKRSTARNVVAGPAEKLLVAGVEALVFTCTFDIDREKWVKRHAIVPSRGLIYVVTLSARAADMEALGKEFDEAVRSFRTFPGK